MLTGWLKPNGFGGLAIAVVVCLQVAESPPARAQQLQLDIARPQSPSDALFLTVSSTRTAERHGLAFALGLALMDDPLVVVDTTMDRERVSAVVGSRLSAMAGAAFGITSWLEAGLEVPVLLTQSMSGSPTGMTGADGGGLGDVRLVSRARFLGRSDAGFSLGAGAALSLPTASDDKFFGSESASFSPSIHAQQVIGPATVAVNLGVHLRESTTLGGMEIGSALTGGLGVAYQLPMAPVWLSGELDLEVAGSDNQQSPMETRIGASVSVTDEMTVQAGYGRGLARGFGAPDHRGMLRIAYRRNRPSRVLRPAPPAPKPRPKVVARAPVDGDGDGIVKGDTCPAEAEDLDGFEDGDGCPDPDNDRDTIPDDDDRCPTRAEDRDGFQDDDGCPDPDNDADSFADDVDACPNESEIINGVSDDDGCPDEGKALVRVGSKRIVIEEQVYFAHNKEIILDKSEAVLSQLATNIKRMPWLEKIRVEGHTDSRGADLFNLELSERRAKSVVKELVKRGVAADRLVWQGLGETQPIDTNRTAVGRANNRRVEFIIVEQGPVPAGFRPARDVDGKASTTTEESR